MKVEELKEKARRHEQREEWSKALDLYRAAIRAHPEDEPADVNLFNRVGDLQTRLGQISGAVVMYEKAIDLYLEAELPNNAIAICKKVLRNLPDRSDFFLRMGQIRGKQGFLTDARENYLTYAERMTAVGDLDSAVKALVEFVDLSPEDVEIRLGLAAQLESQDRNAEAGEQFSEAYRQLALLERDREAEAVAAKLAELAPELSLPDPDEVRREAFERGAEGLGPVEAGFGAFELGSAIEGDEPSPMPEPIGLLEEDVVAEPEDDASVGEEEAFERGLPEEAPVGPLASVLEVETPPSQAMEEALDEARGSTGEVVEEEADGEPLPFLSLEDEEEAEVPSSGFGLEGLEDVMEEAARAFVEDETPAPSPDSLAAPPPPRTHEEAAAQGDLDRAMELVRAGIQEAPDAVELHQRLVEYAFRKADSSVLLLAYLELAGCLIRTGAPAKARAVYQQVLSLSPGHEGAKAAIRELAGSLEPGPGAQVASSEEYVDLGAMILGEEGEKTTRWTVAADAPSGDDQADFAKMLSQFKKKVAQHVDADDVAAHYDLGTAYMEMGLMEEAIGEFQAALRANPRHLPTFEVMGRCWREMGRPDMAVRTLNRALETRFEVEDELIGIYYLMGRAKEELGNTAEAVEFYEKVFSLDINFADVTERLRALR